MGESVASKIVISKQHKFNHDVEKVIVRYNDGWVVELHPEELLFSVLLYLKGRGERKIVDKCGKF